MISRSILIFLITLLWGTACFSQMKGKNEPGIIKGVVRDSVHNYVLKSSTISLYRKSDSVLLAFQLSGNYGEFKFNNIPLNTMVNVFISYTGYSQVLKTVLLDSTEQMVSLGNINLIQQTDTLQDVIIRSVIPVRMNKDTMEFNTDAFKLERTAVVEDMLQQMPGLTVWGDGAITFNGRPISSIVVNGKPFFGGDFRIATQNLSKNVVEKIQLYKQNNNEQNPFDSTLQLNIKLKAGKEKGNFGKLGGGYGATKRYEVDGNFNQYTRKDQVGIVSGINNINKIASNVETLMRNSTFKNNNINADYQPDFQIQGENKFASVGLFLQHDFIQKPDFYNNNKISGNLFYSNNELEKISTTYSGILSGIDSNISRQTSKRDVDQKEEYHYTGEYNNKKQYKNASISQDVYTYNQKREDITKDTSLLSGVSSPHVQTVNEIMNKTNEKGRKMSLKAAYTNRDNGDGFSRLNNNYAIDFSLVSDSKTQQRLSTSKFSSFSGSFDENSFNRKYSNDLNTFGTAVTLSYFNLHKLFFGNKSPLDIEMFIKNATVTNQIKNTGNVYDFDTLSNTYRENYFLTNSSIYKTLEDLPSLSFVKRYNKTYTNRFRKSADFSLTPQIGFFIQKNNSDRHNFQRFKREYINFLPKAQMTFKDDEFGDFLRTFSINYITSMTYPSLDQLYPITDSINLYQLQYGNPNLYASKHREIKISFEHISQRPKQMFSYTIAMSLGNYANAIVDSIVYASDGKVLYYPTNLNGRRYATISLSIIKAIKMKHSELQFNNLLRTGKTRSPYFINGYLNVSNNLNISNELSIFYSDKRLFDISLSHSLYYTKSNQEGYLNNTLSNNSQNTRFAGKINLLKYFSINTNINYHYYSNSFNITIPSYLIWNMSAAVRFLEAQNVEIKFSALDLLKQNTGINSSSSDNLITYTNANVLRQYFMVTLSYFPRKNNR